MRILSLLFLVLVASTPGVMAAESLQSKASVTISDLSHGREHVVSIFSGPDGLLGAVIEGDDKRRDIAWLSPNGQALLAGSLMGPHGEDLTRQAKIAQGLVLSPKMALEEIINKNGRGSIMAGTRGPVLTIFFDPNCIFCHLLYGKLVPLIQAGQVRVRFVIVGTLKASSTPRGAAILGDPNPAMALDSNERSFDGHREEGGFPVPSKNSASMIQAVEANNNLFQVAGLTGTPSTIYCNTKGQVEVLSGTPSNINQFVASAGLAPCP